MDRFSPTILIDGLVTSYSRKAQLAEKRDQHHQHASNGPQVGSDLNAPLQDMSFRSSTWSSCFVAYGGWVTKTARLRWFEQYSSEWENGMLLAGPGLYIHAKSQMTLRSAGNGELLFNVPQVVSLRVCSININSCCD